MVHVSHATGFCAGVYTPLAERLVPYLHVVGMDDRGHGGTRAPADPKMLKNWDIFVEDLERFVDHLNEPVIAVGHSRGAVSSLLMAIKRPDLVRALVLIDPILLSMHWNLLLLLGKKVRMSHLIPIAYYAARRRSVWPSRDAMLSSYGNKFPFRDWKDGFLEAYIQCGTKDTGQGTVTLCCNPAWESRCFAVCPHDVWSFVGRLHQPTLLLYGARSDVFVDSVARRLKSEARSVDVRRFDNTSHFVPMEQPQETVQAILGFLKDNHLV